MTEPKAPAAVVWLERADGRVLALTRGHDFADWHLPGGKWEPVDGEAGNVTASGIATGPNLRATAVRETLEETGILLEPATLRPVLSYHTRSERPVMAYVAETAPPWLPERFPVFPAGQPAWVPTEMLTLAWCTFAWECGRVIRAVKADREARARA